uniref:Uncharacterized protein n=1 Tax=Steinernema glaseri TaxID=37863 RepID=A0A1I7YM76_9BILA
MGGQRRAKMNRSPSRRTSRGTVFSDGKSTCPLGRPCLGEAGLERREKTKGATEQSKGLIFFEEAKLRCQMRYLLPLDVYPEREGARAAGNFEFILCPKKLFMSRRLRHTWEDQKTFASSPGVPQNQRRVKNPGSGRILPSSHVCKDDNEIRSGEMSSRKEYYHTIDKIGVWFVKVHKMPLGRSEDSTGTIEFSTPFPALVKLERLPVL